MCNVIGIIIVSQKFRRKLLVRISLLSTFVSLLSTFVFIRCVCSLGLTTK